MRCPRQQHPCRIHKPVLGTRYSGTVPCHKTCTNHDIAVYYVQLHIDDAILCIINPRRACAARVTVVGSVCVCVCLLSNISPMERLFVLKTLSRTQRATKVKIFVGFSLKPLRCRDPALPPLYGHAYSRPFFSCTRMRISRVYARMIHSRGFSTLVLFIDDVMIVLYWDTDCHLVHENSRG